MQNIDKSIHLFISLLIFSFLILATTHFTGETVLFVPGRYYRLFLECFSVSALFLYLMNPKVSKRVVFLKFPLICVLMLFSVFFLQFSDDPKYYTDSLKFIVSTALMFAFFFAVALRRWEAMDLRMISYAAFVLIALTFMKWVFEGMPVYWEAYGINSNGVGFLVVVICSVLMIGFLLEKGIGRIWFMSATIMGVILLYATSSRAALLFGLALPAFYWIWPMISQNRNRLIIVCILIFLACSIIFPYIYIRLFSLGIDLDNMFLFSKSLSSRFKEWILPLSYFLQKPILGWGIHAEVNVIAGGNYQEAHNAYIELVLRTGLVGIFLYLLFILSIANILWYGRADKVCRFCGAFLMSSLVYQVFERTMIVGTDVDSLIIYFVLGVGLSRVRDLKYRKLVSPTRSLLQERAHTHLT